MAYKPVGVDEDGRFPPRVQEELAETFVSKPVGISNGQVPAWDTATGTWVAKAINTGSEEIILPPTIDGGVWDPVTDTWIHGS